MWDLSTNPSNNLCSGDSMQKAWGLIQHMCAKHLGSQAWFSYFRHISGYSDRNRQQTMHMLNNQICLNNWESDKETSPQEKRKGEPGKNQGGVNRWHFLFESQGYSKPSSEGSNKTLQQSFEARFWLDETEQKHAGYTVSTPHTQVQVIRGIQPRPS